MPRPARLRRRSQAQAVHAAPIRDRRAAVLGDAAVAAAAVAPLQVCVDRQLGQRGGHADERGGGPSPPPRSPPRSPGKSPLPVIQVLLAPLELVSFGYAARANALAAARARSIAATSPKRARRAPRRPPPPAPRRSSSSAAAAASWTSTPYIEELCSFLVCELQALVVSRSPSSAMSDRCFSPPLSPRLVASSPSSPGSPSTPSPSSGPAAPASLPPPPPPLLPAPPPRAADRGSLLVPVACLRALDLTAFAAAAARAVAAAADAAPAPTSPLRLPTDARASFASPPRAVATRRVGPRRRAGARPWRGGAGGAGDPLVRRPTCARVRPRYLPQSAASSAAAAPACASAAVPPSRVGRSGGRGQRAGRHRLQGRRELSVMVVDHLAKQLERRGIAVTVKHRELQRARRRAEASF